MSEGDEAAHGRELDRRRNRVTRRIALVAAAIGVLLAAVSGLLGGGGRAGFAILLLVTAVGCALAALHGVAALLYDDLQERGPSARRGLLAAGLFVLAAILMAMVAGAGG